MIQVDRRLLPKEVDHTAPFLPTLEEIAEGCAKIRQTWTEAEKRKRRGELLPEPWTVPIMPVPEEANLSANRF